MHNDRPTPRTWVLLATLVAIFLLAAATESRAQNAPPGWYSDPYGTGEQIQMWWDGEQWDYDQTRPYPEATITPPEETICTVDGENGMYNAAGDCITAAAYDEIFSYENLAATENPVYPGESVAESYGMTPENTSEPASERPRVFMGEELPSFRELLSIMKFGHLL